MEEKSAGGTTVPTVGFGTYKLSGAECENAVRDALEMGYRHVDTAEFYDNHGAVGRGIAAASVARDDVFLTTKVWKTNLEHSRVLQRTHDALDALDTDYVDLLLIHWPNESVPIEETIDAMNELQREGAVHAIGVSNFSVAQLEAAREASATPIVTNQVEYNPLSPQPDLLEYALDHDVLLTAYSPLGKGDVLQHESVRSIAADHGTTPAQVALRWLVQQDPVVAIPKAANRDHRYENLHVFDFELSNEEMRALFELSGEVPPSMASRYGQ
ncbi:MAG: aldo/keto reductase [Halanaeroarchaeum sp.]